MTRLKKDKHKKKSNINKKIAACIILSCGMAIASEKNKNEYIFNTNENHTISIEKVNMNDYEKMREHSKRVIKIEGIDTEETRKEKSKIKGWMDSICKEVEEYCYEKYDFIFIDKEGEEAFATADGRIFINIDFYKNLKKEEEKVFLINHEVAHIVLKHGYEEYKKAEEIMNIKNEKFNPKIIGESINYYGLGIPGDLRKLIEKQEIEADIMGLLLTKMMGFDIGKSTDFLTKDNSKSMIPHIEKEKRKETIRKTIHILNSLD